MNKEQGVSHSRQRPTRVRYVVVAAACSSALIAYIHRVGFATAGTYLKEDLGLSTEQWGYVMTAFLFAYGLFEIPWGVLGDRLGSRHLLTGVTLGWSLLTAAVAWLVVPTASVGVSLAVLLILRFLFGVFQAGLFPVVARLLTDWVPVTERGTAQGFIWTASRIGGAVAPLLLGLLVLWGGWQTALVLVSLLGVIWVALCWPWLRNRPEDQPAVNAAERQLIAAGAAIRAAGHGDLPWGRLVSSRSVWALCLMYGGVGFAANFYITHLPNYLRNYRKLSDEQMFWLSSLPLFCGIGGCLLGGMLSDWFIRRTGNRTWGRRVNGVIGLSVAGLSLLATNWVEAPGLLALLLCLTFFCNDLNMGPAWATCADLGEHYAGTLGGAMNMVGNLAGAVGATVAGVLLEVGQAKLVFAVFAASFWCAAACWLAVDAGKPLRLSSNDY